MTIKERVINEVSEFSDSKLYAIQEYIDFLSFRETDDERWDSVEHNIPLDDFDYELARRAEEHKGEETVPFEEVLRMFGKTLDDIRD